MARILIDISEEEVKMLDNIAINRSVSRASLIRDAIQVWSKDNKKNKKSKEMFGLLKGNKMVLEGVEYEDSVEYQRKIREERK